MTIGLGGEIAAPLLGPLAVLDADGHRGVGNRHVALQPGVADVHVEHRGMIVQEDLMVVGLGVVNVALPAVVQIHLSTQVEAVVAAGAAVEPVSELRAGVPAIHHHRRRRWGRAGEDVGGEVRLCYQILHQDGRGDATAGDLHGVVGLYVCFETELVVAIPTRGGGP